MQVNLYGSLCISVVFLYCYGHRKKTKFSTESTKIRYFDLKIKKNPREGALPPLQTPLWGGLERDTPSPYPIPLGAYGASTRLAPSSLDLASIFNSWICLC